MPSIRSEDCLHVQKYPQKSSSASIAALRRKEEIAVVYEVHCKDCECVYIGKLAGLSRNA